MTRYKMMLAALCAVLGFSSAQAKNEKVHNIGGEKAISAVDYAIEQMARPAQLSAFTARQGPEVLAHEKSVLGGWKEVKTQFDEKMRELKREQELAGGFWNPAKSRVEQFKGMVTTQGNVLHGRVRNKKNQTLAEIHWDRENNTQQLRLSPQYDLKSLDVRQRINARMTDHSETVFRIFAYVDRAKRYEWKANAATRLWRNTDKDAIFAAMTLRERFLVTKFLGLPRWAVAAMKKGTPFFLSKYSKRTGKQPALSLPKALRPLAKIERSTTRHLSIAGKSVPISRKVYYQLRNRFSRPGVRPRTKN